MYLVPFSNSPERPVEESLWLFFLIPEHLVHFAWFDTGRDCLPKKPQLFRLVVLRRKPVPHCFGGCSLN